MNLKTAIMQTGDQGAKTIDDYSFLISLIIPVYNVEKFVEQCIRSVLDQLPGNCEIICVNDATPDKALDILERILADYSSCTDRVQVISHPQNAGLSAARNTGLSLARGRFIGFLDSDDYLLAGYFDRLLALFDKFPDVDIVSFNASTSGINNQGSWTPGAPLRVNDVDVVWSRHADATGDELYLAGIGRGLWYAPLRVFRLALFEDLEFPDGLLYEDMSLIPKLYVRSHKIIFATENLMCVRANSEGIQRNPDRRHVNDPIAIAENFLNNSRDAVDEFDAGVYFLTACNALYVAAENQGKIASWASAGKLVDNFKNAHLETEFDSYLTHFRRYLSIEKWLVLKKPKSYSVVFAAIKLQGRLKQFVGPLLRFQGKFYKI